MSEECAYHVVNGTNFSFRFTILRGCVRARKTKNNTIVSTIAMKRRIIIFTSIITLKTFNSLRKLCAYLIGKRGERLKHKRFVAKGKRP